MTEKHTWQDFYLEAAELHKKNPHNLCKVYAEAKIKVNMHEELVSVLAEYQKVIPALRDVPELVAAEIAKTYTKAESLLNKAKQGE